jgi:hypothetical protein
MGRSNQLESSAAKGAAPPGDVIANAEAAKVDWKKFLRVTMLIIFLKGQRSRNISSRSARYPFFTDAVLAARGLIQNW